MTTQADPRRGISRAIRWTGIALGTCMAVLAFMDGARLRIGGMPSWLGLVLGAVVTWALIVVASTALAELTRRHHRTVARTGWRLGKRGATGAYRGTATWSRPHRARIGAALRARWPGPGGTRLVPGAADDGQGDCIYCGAGDGQPCTVDCAYRRQDRRAMRRIRRGRQAVTDPGPEDPPDDPVTAADPPRRVCVACGNPEGGKWGPLVTYDPVRDGAGWGDGPRLIHKSHFEDESTGFYGRPYKEGTDMTDRTDRTGPRRVRERARAGARRAAEGAGGAWRQLIAATADYEPEDDSALLDWMAGEAAGMASYAESITDVYDTAVSGVGLDPVPLAALHDYADAAAACAEAMAAARARFAEHYSQVREFAAAGGLLPHDGRWITGEGGE
jgi:hypothetical protein